MSDYPLVSVCIANYNGEKILNECINSVLKQDYKHFEIIIHDDCSTDKSLAVLDSYKGKIKVINSTVNIGFCVSNNRMVSNATGKYVLLLNNDAVLESTAISSLVSAARTECYGILTLVQKDYQSGEIIDNGRDLDIFLNPVPSFKQSHEVQDVMMVHGACLFISKKLWDEIGGFPDSFGSIAEDLFISLTAIAKGYKVGSLNTSYYRHRNGYSFGGGSIDNQSLSTSFNRRYLSERNRLLVMYILFPWSFRPWIFLQLLFLLIEGTLLSLIKVDSKIFFLIYYKAIRDFWKTKKLSVSGNHHTKLPHKVIFRLKILPYKLSMLLRFGLPEISDST